MDERTSDGGHAAALSAERRGKGVEESREAAPGAQSADGDAELGEGRADLGVAD